MKALGQTGGLVNQWGNTANASLDQNTAANTGLGQRQSLGMTGAIRRPEDQYTGYTSPVRNPNDPYNLGL